MPNGQDESEHMFESLNIPKKLGLSFITINVSAAVMMIVFGASLLMIGSATERNNESQAIYADAQTLETALLRQNSQFRGFLVTGDESYLKSYDEGRDDYDKTSAALEARLVDPKLKSLVRESRDETVAWRKNWGDRYIAVVKSGQRDAAQVAVRDAGKSVLVSAAVLPLRGLREHEEKAIASNAARQSTAITFAWIALVVGGLALLGLAIVLSRKLSRAIAVPITALTRTMKRLADGDHDLVVPGTDRTDELGDMAKAVLVFRDAAAERVHAVADRERAMAEIGAQLHAVAQSDLTARITDMPPAFEGLAEDFNEAMEKLCAAMASVQGSIQGINLTSNEIRQATMDLSVRSEQQAASLQSSSGAMSDLTGKVTEYAGIASEASRSMIEARSEAEKGGNVVGQAIEAMTGVDRASSDIADIITLIDGIAFQTNLLALNAGVEAARAGEAGKGFAVVASEVRALALRATDAANEIKTRVSAVTDHVRIGAGLVNQTGEALERIIERVSRVSTSIEAIAETANLQSAGLAQVSSSIHEMDAMTQQNAAMVEETTAATKSLAREADQLTQAFSSFRVGGEAGAGIKRGTVASRLSGSAGMRAPEPARSKPASQLNVTPLRRAAAPAPARAPAPAQAGNIAVNGDDWSEF